MEFVLYRILDISSLLFQLYVVSGLMRLFLGPPTKKTGMVLLVYLFREVVCRLQYVYLPYALVNMLVSAGTLFVITLCYEGKRINKLTTVVLICFCSFVAEVVVAGVLTIQGGKIIINEHNGNAFSFMGMSIILWIIYEIVRTFKNITTRVVIPKAFNIIITVLSILLFMMETAIFLQENIADSIKVLSAVIILAVLFLMIYLYDVLSKYYVESIQAELIEREKDIYFKQAELLQNSGKALRDFRHDMNNHLYAIRVMIGEENEEAKNYIENLLKKIDKTKMYSNTGNIAIDGIINYKFSEAAAKNIPIYSSIVMPSGIKNGVEDIVAILGNLLDNAIEASESSPDNQYIHLDIQYRPGRMFIEVKNGYNGMINQENGELKTGKKDKQSHGIGLKSVETAVSHYDGEVKVEFDTKEFRVNVMLYTE